MSAQIIPIRKETKRQALEEYIEIGVATSEDYVAALEEMRDSGPDRPGYENRTIEELLSHWVWVADIKRWVHKPDGTMWDRDQFDSKYNRLVDTASISKALYKTTTRSDLVKLNKLIYRPGGPEIERGNYNKWRPPLVIPSKGDTTLWNEHLTWLIPNPKEVEEVLNWLAWVYQHQDLKPTYALLIIGKAFGTGKSFIADVFEQLIGPNNTSRPENSSLTGQFNPYVLSKLIIIEELMQIGRRDMTNKMRTLITQPRGPVNIKNVPHFDVDYYSAVIGLTNHADALPLEDGERRWLGIDVPWLQNDPEVVKRKANGYYKELYAILQNPMALGAIAYELQHRELGNYAPLGDAPMTAAKQTMIDLATPSLVRWLREQADSPPFNGRYISITRDVLPILPERFKNMKQPESEIAKWLKDELHGKNLGYHRVGPNKIVLWSINEHEAAETPSQRATDYLMDWAKYKEATNRAAAIDNAFGVEED